MKAEWKEFEGQKYFKFDKKFDETRYFHGNLINIGLCIFIIIAVIIAGFYIYNYKDALISNPLVFGAKQMDSKNNGYLNCSCIFYKTDGVPFKFTFDEFDTYPIKQGYISDNKFIIPNMTQ